MKELKDLFGKDLAVGDRVVFTMYHNEQMFIGHIVRESNACLFLECETSKWCTARVRKHDTTERIIKI
jgi:hypothetical protein